MAGGSLEKDDDVETNLAVFGVACAPVLLVWSVGVPEGGPETKASTHMPIMLHFFWNQL